MRVSFESGFAMTSVVAAWAAALTSSLQQPTPAMVGVVVSLRQWPCGTSMPGAVPEPGCDAFGGMAYVLDVEHLVAQVGDGVAELSDPVLLIVQTIRLVDVRPCRRGRAASSPALELMKYSALPPLPVGRLSRPDGEAGLGLGHRRGRVDHAGRVEVDVR